MNWTAAHQRQWDRLSPAQQQWLLGVAKDRAAAKAVRRARDVPWTDARSVRRSSLDEAPVFWTAKHQRLWDRLEYHDPISPEGQHRYAERQAELARAAEVRQAREDRYEARNLRSRLAGAVAARRQRMAPDPYMAMWGQMGREPDRGDRFARGAANEYWGEG